MSNQYHNRNFQLFIANMLMPHGFIYPESFILFSKATCPFDLKPWDYFFNDEEINFFFKGLQKRYPARCLVPFFRKIDNDDVACFDGSDTSGDPRVFIIHDWASPGWEERGTFQNFSEWLKFAEQESEEWKNLGG